MYVRVVRVMGCTLIIGNKFMRRQSVDMRFAEESGEGGHMQSEKWGKGKVPMFWKARDLEKMGERVYCARDARARARVCVRVSVCVWCAWCVRRTTCVVRARVCVYVVRVVRAAHRAEVRARVCVCVVRVVRTAHRVNGARACVCVCGARDAHGTLRAWCARVCVCVWCAWCARRTARLVRSLYLYKWCA